MEGEWIEGDSESVLYMSLIDISELARGGVGIDTVIHLGRREARRFYGKERRS